MINLLPQPKVTPTELNHFQFYSVGVGSAHVILLLGCWVLEGSREEWWCQRKWGKNMLTFSSNHELFRGTSPAVVFIQECWVSFVWAWKTGQFYSHQWYKKCAHTFLRRIFVIKCLTLPISWNIHIEICNCGCTGLISALLTISRLPQWVHEYYYYVCQLSWLDLQHVFYLC